MKARINSKCKKSNKAINEGNKWHESNKEKWNFHKKKMLEWKKLENKYKAWNKELNERALI